MNEPSDKPQVKNGQNNKPAIQQDDWVKKIIDFINQPAVANLGLGAYLQWVFDPKGSQRSLEEIQRQLKKITNMLEDQAEDIARIKKRLMGNNNEDENLSGTNNSKKKERAKSIYLD